MPINRLRPFFSECKGLLLAIKNARTIRTELVAEKNALDAARGALSKERAYLVALKAKDEIQIAAIRSAAKGAPLDQIKSAIESIPSYYLRLQKERDSFEERSKQQKAYAILATTGRAATHWLTAAFNLHDDVFYSHGPDTNPKKGTGSENENLNNFLRNWAQMGKIDPDDPDAYFDMLETREGHIAYGNIHGLMPPVPKSGAEPFRRHYFATAIFRHPVTRIQSLINRWLFESSVSELRRTMNSPENLKTTQPEVYDRLVKDYGVETVDEVAVLFVAAVRDTVPWDHHCIQSGLPLFQMERLVSDIDYFLALFNEATAGLVEPNGHYIQKVRDLKAIDRRGRGEPAIQVFAAWKPWMRRYFRDAVAESNLADAYHTIGYDLRMILK